MLVFFLTALWTGGRATEGLLLGFPALGGQMGEWRSPQNVTLRQKAKRRGSSPGCPILGAGWPSGSSGLEHEGCPCGAAGKV